MSWLGSKGSGIAGGAERGGFICDERMPEEIERFTLVWPPGDADPEGTQEEGCDLG